jgi:hypothetical protein
MISMIPERFIHRHKWHFTFLVIIVIIVQLFFASEIVHNSRILSVTTPAVEGHTNHNNNSNDHKVQLPLHIEQNLIDKSKYLQLVKNHDYRVQKVTPFYWHVAKAGGTAVKDLYVSCFTLITASEIGYSKHEDEDFLRVVHAIGSTNHLNVDTSTINGIKRASNLGLVPSHIPQLIFSPLFDEATEFLFDTENQGIMFAMFRDPIERVISLFYYLQEATWEPTYNPELKNMSLLEYVNSPLVEANFIVRSLVNKFTEKLSPDDLAMAKEILRRKCIIGLVKDFDSSITQFDASLDLAPNLHVHTERDAEHQSREDYVESCVKNLKEGGGSNKHSHRKVDVNSEEYKILEKKNGWDVNLWAYIQELYEEQKIILNPIVEGTEQNY